MAANTEHRPAYQGNDSTMVSCTPHDHGTYVFRHSLTITFVKESAYVNAGPFCCVVTAAVCLVPWGELLCRTQEMNLFTWQCRCKHIQRCYRSGRFELIWWYCTVKVWQTEAVSLVCGCALMSTDRLQHGVGSAHQTCGNLDVDEATDIERCKIR